MRHPHAEAIYSVIPSDDGTFAVQVSIPDTYPTTVRPFETSMAAERWIIDHREHVQSQSQLGRWQRRPAVRSRQ